MISEVLFLLLHDLVEDLFETGVIEPGAMMKQRWLFNYL
jgi:hypothetical protein